MDIYQPSEGGAAQGSRPLLVLAFGGAFHRGSKENDSFEVDGRRNTAIAEYCEVFARRGFVCASVDYRLVIEDPDPDPPGAVENPSDIPRSRVDQVREQLGYPPATEEMLWRGIEAAANDLDKAVRYLSTNAERYGIDRRRIAVGGWSAGARTALNAAFAKGAPVRAAVSLSGYMACADLHRLVRPGRPAPAVFLAWGEHDLGYVAQQNPVIDAHLRSMGLRCVALRLPGATHFYERAASSGRLGATTLEDALAIFLEEHLVPCEDGTLT